MFTKAVMLKQILYVQYLYSCLNIYYYCIMLYCMFAGRLEVVRLNAHGSQCLIYFCSACCWTHEGGQEWVPPHRNRCVVRAAHTQENTPSLDSYRRSISMDTKWRNLMGVRYVPLFIRWSFLSLLGRVRNEGSLSAWLGVVLTRQQQRGPNQTFNFTQSDQNQRS